MSKSKEPKPVSEFTEEQREYFSIMQKYERKLQPFLSKSIAPGSPESKELEAIELERETELNEFRKKYCKPETIDTPDKLGQWIDQELVTIDMIKMANRGEFPFERAKESYKKAREYARKIRESNPGLPILPPRLSDPEDGLQSMQEWCKEADKTVDDILYSLGQQTINKIISLFKKLRDFASKVRSLVDNKLQIKIQNEINVECKKKREQLEGRIQAEIDRRLAQQKSTFAAEGIQKMAFISGNVMSNVGAPLVIAAKAQSDILQDIDYTLEVGKESKAVQSYLSKDPAFNDRLSQQSKEICEVVKKIDKLAGSNTPTRKLLDIYCKLKDIPLERQFKDVEHACSLQDLDDVIFGNCSGLYASIDTVIKTFEEIQTKAEHKANLAERPAETERDTTPAKRWGVKRITGWIFKKTWHLICAIVVAVIAAIIAAIIVDIFYDFGWLQSIKEFIYNFHK